MGRIIIINSISLIVLRQFKLSIDWVLVFFLFLEELDPFSVNCHIYLQRFSWYFPNYCFDVCRICSDIPVSFLILEFVSSVFFFPLLILVEFWLSIDIFKKPALYFINFSSVFSLQFLWLLLLSLLFSFFSLVWVFWPFSRLLRLEYRWFVSDLFFSNTYI